VRKSQSPKLAPSQFERELVWSMRAVLDLAVDQIDAANRTPATKAKMAERILRAASDGITDPMTLTAIAIEDGMQPAD
jgi:phenylpyruvate tautomerase PptA (4-oxalocrotonate tautomerase family)